jgi:hypothetical protein
MDVGGSNAQPWPVGSGRYPSGRPGPGQRVGLRGIGGREGRIRGPLVPSGRRQAVTAGAKMGLPSVTAGRARGGVARDPDEGA